MIYQNVAIQCETSINSETEITASVIKIDDISHKLHKQPTFITVADHKEDFPDKPQTDYSIHPKIISVKQSRQSSKKAADKRAVLQESTSGIIQPTPLAGSLK